MAQDTVKKMAPTALPWWSFPKLAKTLARFLSPEHKRRFYLVSAWACVLSILEMLVAAAVIPYVGCLSGHCPAVVTKAVGTFDLPMIPALSLGLLVLISLKLVVQAVLNWFSMRFTQQVQRDTIGRLLEGYLHLGWMDFRKENRTYYFRRCATTAVDAAYVCQQCVTLVSSSLILIFLTGLMLWQYPLVSLLLAILFIGLNSSTQALLGRAQKHAAQKREHALHHWNTGMAEAFASFREIRVYKLERFFLQHVGRSIDELASSNVKLNFYPTLPRLVLDFAVLAILLLVVSIWVFLQRPLAELLPQLIFYAVVARTMLPAMMNLLSIRTGLIGAILNIELVLSDLEHAKRNRVARIEVPPHQKNQSAFLLENVTFRHADSLPSVLQNVNLELKHPSWLAVTGPSGAGKSTLMELLCGIHVPDSGEVIHAWNGPARPSIAYLPQHVALLDTSIMQNVVFGFDQADEQRVMTALDLAGLAPLIERLPAGLQAPAGADGANLSGGERQRLALARALYRNPDLLLLDEATSGLDEKTETRVLSRLRQECPQLSVVYITHRQSNLRFADRIVHLQDGRLEDVFPDLS